MTSALHHRAWLAVRLAPEMTRPRFYNLMAAFASPDEVLGAPAAEIARVRGFDLTLARGVLESGAGRAADEHGERLAALGARVVCRDDAEYPANLRLSSLEPPMLFVRGTLQAEDRFAISMVGSRHATQYGRAVAAQLAEGLARCGITVISGFARGIDGEAHNAVVKAKGRTLAVLGNGLDVCYPSEHRGLGETVIGHGALISEYPLGTPPDRYNFPERNHVIAALGLGTIVVEAAEKSGSLITARLAVEENRFIFAVPGDITRNNSRGANGLIQQGARLVQRHQDVLIEMKDVLRGYLDEALLTEEEEPAPVKRGARKRKELVDGGEVMGPDNMPEKELPSVSPAPTAATGKGHGDLTDDELFIVELLRHEAQLFDELAAHAYGRGMDTARLTSLLMKLELRRVIRQLPGRYYVMFE